MVSRGVSYEGDALGMQPLLSERLSRVLAAARRERDLRGSDTLQIEDLIVALLGDGAAREALGVSSVEVPRALEQLRMIRCAQVHEPADRRTPANEEVAAALRFATTLALSLQVEVHVDHLLIALLRAQGGSTHLLAELGIDGRSALGVLKAKLFGRPDGDGPSVRVVSSGPVPFSEDALDRFLEAALTGS